MSIRIRVLLCACLAVHLLAVSAIAEPRGIRGAFFDLIDNPWELADRDIDESRSARFIADGLLVIDDGRIIDFGPYADTAPKHAGIEITAYKDRLIMPGLIDGHTHFPQIRVIGAYGRQLLEWLQEYIFPEESLYFDPEYARTGAEKFIRDNLASGTTTFQAFTTTRPETTVALFDEADRHNMRIIAGVTGIDRNAPDYYKDTPESFYVNSKRMIEKYHGKNRLLYAITPRFAFGSTAEQLTMCGKLKREHADCWVNTHLSETPTECRGVARYFPDCEDYLAVYEKYGLVGPKFSGGHSIWLSESEFQRMHDAGACSVFCACSNLWLGSGLFQLGSATDPRRPVLIAVGTDVGAGNTCSLFRVLNDSYKVGMLNNGVYNGNFRPSQKDLARAERNKLSPYRAFYLATLGGARALRLDPWLGNFQPGKEADFIVIDLHTGPLEQSWVVSRVNAAQPAEPGSVPDAAFIQGRPFPQTTKQCAMSLLAVIAMGDSRAVEETWIMGKKVWPAAKSDVSEPAADRR